MRVPDVEREIRRCAMAGSLVYTKHAIQRVGERGIEKPRITEALVYGKVLEYQVDDGMYKLLFQEHTTSAPEFYVVAKYTDTAVVITVCLSMDEFWDIEAGTMTRKKKGT